MEQPSSKLLRDRFPSIYKAIDPILNKGIDYENITYGLGLKLWFRCPTAKCTHHTWSSTVNQMTSKNRTGEVRCPFCSGRKTCHCDSFMTKYPLLASQFKSELNPGIDPYTIPCGSHTKLVWFCTDTTCGHHIWGATVHGRVANYIKTKGKSSGCSFCESVQTCSCDSFMTKYPVLVTQFIPELNPGIDPYTIACFSSIKLTWKCPDSTCCDHVWVARVSDRTKNNRTNCPYCFAGGKVCPCGNNSLASKFPELMKEFDKNINPKIDPTKLLPCSGEYINWKCSDGHIWSCQVADRTKSNGTGCPNCPKQSSKLELRCKKHLENLGIEFICQKDFDDCVYIYRLRFDFYLTHKRAIIEADGGFHFKEIFGSLRECQIRDFIKEEYCRKTGIHLLRISHSEETNMETIIDQFLRDIENAKETIIRFVGKEYQNRPKWYKGDDGEYHQVKLRIRIKLKAT